METIYRGTLEAIRRAAREALEYSNKEVDNPDLNQVRMWNDIISKVNKIVPSKTAYTDLWSTEVQRIMGEQEPQWVNNMFAPINLQDVPFND